jgi:hypothetical protein
MLYHLNTVVPNPLIVVVSAVFVTGLTIRTAFVRNGGASAKSRPGEQA